MAPIWYDGSSFKLYFYAHEEHQRPHVAVRIGSRNVASVDLLSGAIPVGELPPKVHRRIRQLLDEHREAAVEAFQQALKGDSFVRLAETKGEDDA